MNSSRRRRSTTDFFGTSKITSNLFTAVVVSVSIYIQIRFLIKQPPRLDDDSNLLRRYRSFSAWFDNNKGWHHPNLALSYSEDLGTSLILKGDRQPNSVNIIRKGELVMIIPSSLVFTAESCRNLFQQLDNAVGNDIVLSINRFWTDPLQQQDTIIALALMMECMLGKASSFHPYLELLPEVPRLDTFSESDLELLQDDYLATLARESANTIRKFWKGTGRKALKALAKQRAATLSDGKLLMNSSCVSYDNFHRYMAVVGSRAMILNSTKYLTPMADMVNHRENIHSHDLFETFHKLNADGSISVFADRDMTAGGDFFEEYGKLDNSLYLMVFGFVPNQNPYHCAAILSSCLPKLEDSTLRHLAAHVVSPQLLNVEDICVFKNGSLLHDDMVGYLALFNLQSSEEPRKRCLDAYQSGSSGELIRQLCLKYAGWAKGTQRTIQQSANCSLVNAVTSLEEDVDLLKALQMQAPSPTRAILALRFRVFEKQLLVELSQGGAKI